MAHVILITYSGYITAPSSLALDNGLANLAGAIIKHGHQALVLDYNNLSVLSRFKKTDGFHSIQTRQASLNKQQEIIAKDIYEEIKAAIAKNKSIAVGFKCWGSEGAWAVKRWCNSIRKDFPRVKILIGGPMCETMPHAIAKFLGTFDYIVTAEGERSIVKILDHLEGKCAYSDIPNLIDTKTELIDDLDELPFPCYSPEVYPSAHTGEKINMVILDESRGCPNSCSFCVHPIFAGRRRTKSPDRVIAEIRAVQAQLRTRIFRFAGSNTPPSLLDELSVKLAREAIDIRFSCFMHLNDVDPDKLHLYHQAGLRSVFYGMETADDDQARFVCSKAVNAENARNLIFATSASGIFATTSFIYPLPGQTTLQTRQTLAFVKQVFGNNPLSSAIFLNPYPLPRTEWWTERKKYGFELDEDEYLFKVLTVIPRHLFPPEMQEMLPYSLNGKSHRVLAEELSKFMSDLAKSNIIFNVSDDVAIIAYGCGLSPRKLREELMPAFINCSTDKIMWMINEFNRNRVKTG